ncbi:MAG TPA: cobalamin-independent methionine synthase II family protein [Baekduia sp.]|nr:cobalamin-independent methionine synthase II family protein [Baekduia sp.]
MNTNEPIRSDNLGSLLRPQYLRDAQENPELSAAEQRAIEDRAILEVIALQEAVGLPIVTDGEFRRRHFFSTLVEVADGVDAEGYERRHRDDAGNWFTVRTPTAVERLRRKSTLAELELAFVRAHSDRLVKVTLPAPSLLAAYWNRDTDGPYPTRAEYLDHLVELTREDVAALAAAGADHVQLDAPHYSYIATILPDADDPDATLVDAVRRDQEVFEGVDVTSALHVCRGNNRSRYVGSDPYEAFAKVLFPEIHVDRVLLEYDDDRSGGFDPLRLFPDDVLVVLGLLTTKLSTIEDRDTLRARIDEAADVIGFERLALSTQCGFASDAEGNAISAEAQRAKLQIVTDLAGEVWG